MIKDHDLPLLPKGPLGLSSFPLQLDIEEGEIPTPPHVEEEQVPMPPSLIEKEIHVTK